MRSPRRDDVAEEREPAEGEQHREHEAVLEPQPGSKPPKDLILLADEVDAESARRKSCSDRLNSDQDEQAADDLRVDVQAPAEDRDMHEHEQRDQRPREQHHDARQKEEKCRVVDEDDTQVPPAVPKRLEL